MTTDLIPSQGILSVPGLELTDTSLTMPPPSDDPAKDFETWSTITAMVGRVARSTQWWVGDALLSGEKRFGEVASQYSDITGYEKKTLMNFVWVCRAVDPARRRADLTFGHHALVAGQASSIQDYWLRAAAENGWSIEALREAMQPEIEAEYDVAPDSDEGEENEEETADRSKELKIIDQATHLVQQYYQSLDQSAKDKAHDRVTRTLKVLRETADWLESQEE
jgi:hypothetical protein